MTVSRLLTNAARAAAVVCAAGGLGGCVSVTSSAVVMTGIAAQQQRGVSGRLEDLKISASLRRKLYDHNHVFAADIGVTVYDGRLVLTGMVRDENDRDAIIAMARSTPGIRDLIDELVVIDPAQVDVARDALISSELETRLVFDKDVDSVNYTVTTVNRTVFVIGTARDRDELTRILSHARDIGHVRRVVPHVWIGSAHVAGT